MGTSTRRNHTDDWYHRIVVSVEDEIVNEQQQKFQAEVIKLCKNAYDQGAKDVIDTLKDVLKYYPNDTSAIRAIRQFVKDRS